MGVLDIKMLSTLSMDGYAVVLLMVYSYCKGSVPVNQSVSQSKSEFRLLLGLSEIHQAYHHRADQIINNAVSN